MILGVFFQQKRRSWDFLTCYKLGEVCNPAAGAFFSSKNAFLGFVASKNRTATKT